MNQCHCISICLALGGQQGEWNALMEMRPGQWRQGAALNCSFAVTMRFTSYAHLTVVKYTMKMLTLFKFFGTWKCRKSSLCGSRLLGRMGKYVLPLVSLVIF